MKILVTGASGFIGSFMVERGILDGHSVWAGIRQTSSLRYLNDPRTNLIELNLSDQSLLRRQLTAHQKAHGKWDCIIHAAGATKCRDKSEFFRTNTEGTRLLADTLCQLDMIPQQFIFISSLSVYGPIREKPVPRKTADMPFPSITDFSRTGSPLATSIYTAINESDIPHPNTAYGQSKYEAEQYLQRLKGFPWVIFRPTGVYGPREHDYFLMAKSISKHIDFAAGFNPQEITFVYVKDLVQAVYRAIEQQVTERCYFVSDGFTYSSRSFSDLLQKELGVRHVIHFISPLWLLRLICQVSEKTACLTDNIPTLNSDKYHIMKQRNWLCDIRPLAQELGYVPQYDLRRGVAETVAWYKKEKWL